MKVIICAFLDIKDAFDSTCHVTVDTSFSRCGIDRSMVGVSFIDEALVEQDLES